MNRQQIKKPWCAPAVWLAFPALLLAGCLSDVNSAFHPEVTPAVVHTDQIADLVVAETRFGNIYAAGLNSNADGTCLVVDFTYNASDPANADYNQTGYYNVTLKKQTPVDQADAQPSGAGTETLLSYEQPVLYAIFPETPHLYACLSDYLFLPSVYTTTVGRQVNWQCTYPTPLQSETIDDKRVYTLYLRAAATQAPPEAARDTTLAALHAFNLAPFIEEAKKQAGWDERTHLYVAIHYIDAINAADSTDFHWAATEPLQVR